MQWDIYAADSKEPASLACPVKSKAATLGLASLIICIMNSIKMEPESAPLVASDGNEDKKYLMTLSITELISNLRTAFRMIDYDRVEEVLIEKETKLKAEIKALTEKLELETLMRMSAEEECKERKNVERYEILLESVKKNNELDHENTVAELRIKNTKLENEKCLAESVAESWKRKFEELSERFLMVEKDVDSFMNGDAHVGIGGKVEELSSIQGNTHPGVSNKVTGKKDMNVVDICDNERGKTTAGSAPLQRKDLKSGNTPVSAAKVTRQSPDSPNKALLGASGDSTEDMDKQDKNEVDRCDCDCGNTDTSPSQREMGNSGNTHSADDSVTRCPDTLNVAVLDTSANGNSPLRKTVIEIEDNDDDECIISGSSNRKEAARETAAAVDDNGHSSLSDQLQQKSNACPVGVKGMIESFKRKWFPELGKQSDGLNENLVDGCDADNDTSSSTSSSDSELVLDNEVQLPSSFLSSTCDKRRKT